MKNSTILTVVAATVLGIGSIQCAERFDRLVRSDFFRGFAGDQAALARGLAACEKVLASDPQDAEALVWHGSGTYFLAGQAFRAGDRQKGSELAAKALREMDLAVELEPRNLAVRIPRGATLLTATRHMSPEIARPLRQKALTDYELALEKQGSALAGVTDHARGELLSGLAELYLRLGQPEKAAPYLKQLVSGVAGKPYADRASEWTATGEPANAQCMGCHVQ